MSAFLKRLHALLIEGVLAPVKLYRKFSAKRAFGRCKYLPTCSQYCIDAFREWGVLRGFFLSLWRVLRCNPFSKGGFDPVPQRKRKNDRGDRSENGERS